MERKGEFWCYYGFVVRRVEMKVRIKNCDMIPFMARCDLWDWKCCDEKLYGGVVLCMVRVRMIERSTFESKWVILWLCSMIVEMV